MQPSIKCYATYVTNEGAAIGAEIGATPAQTALAWILTRPRPVRAPTTSAWQPSTSDDPMAERQGNEDLTVDPDAEISWDAPETPNRETGFPLRWIPQTSSRSPRRHTRRGGIAD